MLNRTRAGGLFVEGQMAAVSVMIVDETLKHRRKMFFTKDDHIVERFSPDRRYPTHALHHGRPL